MAHVVSIQLWKLSLLTVTGTLSLKPEESPGEQLMAAAHFSEENKRPMRGRSWGLDLGLQAEL